VVLGVVLDQACTEYLCCLEYENLAICFLDSTFLLPTMDEMHEASHPAMLVLCRCCHHIKRKHSPRCCAQRLVALRLVQLVARCLPIVGWMAKPLFHYIVQTSMKIMHTRCTGKTISSFEFCVPTESALQPQFCERDACSRERSCCFEGRKSQNDVGEQSSQRRS
jgi:hypothetical protein